MTDMKVINIAQGEPAEKLVDGHKKRIIPAITAEVRNMGVFGIGYRDAETGKGEYWGPITPQNLLQSWRAMKILTEVPVIRFGTLANCWTVVDERSLDRHDLEHSFDSLARDFDPGYQVPNRPDLPREADWVKKARTVPWLRKLFTEVAIAPEPKSTLGDLRTKMLQTFPTPAELEAMVSILLEHQIYNPARELTPHINDGRFPRTANIIQLERGWANELSAIEARLHAG